MSEEQSLKIDKVHFRQQGVGWGRLALTQLKLFQYTEFEIQFEGIYQF